MLIIEAVGELIERFNVTVESHPAELTTVVVYDPLDVYVFPFNAHVYGPQAFTFCVVAVLEAMVKFKIEDESHPLVVNPFTEYVPDAVYV